MVRGSMEGSLTRLSLRFLLRRKQRAVLTALGISLGVAILTSLVLLLSTVQVALDEEARRGFGRYDLVAGYEDRTLTPAEQKRVADVNGVAYTVSVLVAAPPPQVGSPASQHELQYVGVGEFPKESMMYPLSSGRYPARGEFVTEEKTAAALGLSLGDVVRVPMTTGEASVVLVGLTRSVADSQGHVLIFPLQWLQQHMHQPGQAARLLVGVEPGVPVEAVATRIQQALPALEVRKNDADVGGTTGALGPIALALGVAGLVASGFLVAASFQIAVHERERELALLRAIGATPRQVMRLVRREAVVLGAIGAMCGVLVGVVGALAAVHGVAAYLSIPAREMVLRWDVLAGIASLGVILAAVAGRFAAKRAGVIPPLQAMRGDVALQSSGVVKTSGLGGIVILSIGAVALAVATMVEPGSAPKALLGVVGALALVSGLIKGQDRFLPLVTSVCVRPVAPFAPAEAKLAARSVLRHRQRASLTASILTLAIMLAVGAGTVFLYIGGRHESTLRNQIPTDGIISADFGYDLGHDLAQQVRGIDGVEGVAAVGPQIAVDIINYDWRRADQAWLARMNSERDRWMMADPVTSLGLVRGNARDLASVYDLGLIEGTLDAKGLILTREQATARGIRVGDVMTLRPAQLARDRYGVAHDLSLTVVAVVERLPFDSISVLVVGDYWPNLPDARVYFAYDLERHTEVSLAVQHRILQAPHGMVQSRFLAPELEEGERTLQQYLVLLGAVVATIAVLGLLGLIMSTITGIHERRRELATIRAVGATPAQMTRQLVLEALFIGQTGSVMGLIAAFMLIAGLSLGLGEWLHTAYPPALYAMCLLGIPLIGAASTLSIVRKAVRPSVSEALRSV